MLQLSSMANLPSNERCFLSSVCLLLLPVLPVSGAALLSQIQIFNTSYIQHASSLVQRNGRATCCLSLIRKLPNSSSSSSIILDGKQI
ncbi:hypothetical protein T4C_12897 [Trichinella pseudospiralis]|uniref:Secreted protein n=1 Tax=Trichinella pseudospiralis TaxID=6337 RepID=A0A0V1JJZ2_TRIPS|nr:hypothetical protein T4C_12897 [Trichinella pseudospiralis]